LIKYFTFFGKVYVRHYKGLLMIRTLYLVPFARYSASHTTCLHSYLTMHVTSMLQYMSTSISYNYSCCPTDWMEHKEKWEPIPIHNPYFLKHTIWPRLSLSLYGQTILKFINKYLTFCIISVALISHLMFFISMQFNRL
jgi:hypothetical protein